MSATNCPKIPQGVEYLAAASIGLHGTKTIADESVSGGPWIGIQAETDITIVAITGLGMDGEANLAGLTLYAGETRTWVFSDIEITGKATLFNLNKPVA